MTISKRIGSKLRRESKYLLRDVKYELGLLDNFYRSARGSRIVVYHGICKDDHLRFNPIFLKRDTFESHLKFYKKYFNIISLDDYYEGRFSADRFNVCITFDDGFANNHKYVLPLLEQYQLPATFFITAIRSVDHDILWNDFLGIVSKYGPHKITYKGECYYKGRFDKYISEVSGVSLVERLHYMGFAEKAEMMEILYPMVPFKTNKQDEEYWLQMTIEQIKELSISPFVTIGAHGHYHNNLEKISIRDAGDELTFSKAYLESLISKPINSCAFPYGTYTPQVIEAAKKAGYQQLLATDFNSNHDQNDPAMRERFTVNPFISTSNQMYATIVRRYEH